MLSTIFVISIIGFGLISAPVTIYLLGAALHPVVGIAFVILAVPFLIVMALYNPVHEDARLASVACALLPAAYPFILALRTDFFGSIIALIALSMGCAAISVLVEWVVRRNLAEEEQYSYQQFAKVRKVVQKMRESFERYEEAFVARHHLCEYQD